MTVKLATFGFVLLLLGPFQRAEADTISGEVVTMADGDLLIVLVDRERLKLRLVGIDAPEKAQPFGDNARQELARVVFGKTIEVATTGRDR